MKIFPCSRKFGISGNYVCSYIILPIKMAIYENFTLSFLIFLFFPNYQLQLMTSDMIILICDIMIWGSWSPGRTILCVEWLGELGAVLLRQVYLGLTKLQWSLQSSVLTSTCSLDHIELDTQQSLGTRQSDRSNDHLYIATLTQYWTVSSQISEWIHTFPKHNTWR